MSKIVVITGASGGIGAALAESLTRRGASIIFRSPLQIWRCSDQAASEMRN